MFTKQVSRIGVGKASSLALRWLHLRRLRSQSQILDYFDKPGLIKTLALPGNTYLKERISAVNLLVLTSSDELFKAGKQYFSFYTERPFLIRSSTVSSVSFLLVFPCITIRKTSCTARLLPSLLGLKLQKSWVRKSLYHGGHSSKQGILTGGKAHYS